jgi:hypothetical protein
MQAVCILQGEEEDYFHETNRNSPDTQSTFAGYAVEGVDQTWSASAPPCFYMQQSYDSMDQISLQHGYSVVYSAAHRAHDVAEIVQSPIGFMLKAMPTADFNRNADVAGGDAGNSLSLFRYTLPGDIGMGFMGMAMQRMGAVCSMQGTAADGHTHILQRPNPLQRPQCHSKHESVVKFKNDIGLYVYREFGVAESSSPCSRPLNKRVEKTF